MPEQKNPERGTTAESDTQERRTATEDTSEERPPESDGEGRARFSMSKVILAILAFLVGAVAILMTLGPTVSPRDVVELDKAFVHGAVTNVGIAEDARIAELHVDLGDFVEEGDVVATLERDHLEARMRSAEARVARLEAELGRAGIAAQIAQRQAATHLEQVEAEVVAARAQREAAEAELDLNRGQLARKRQLLERDIVPEVEVDAAREKVERAQAFVVRRAAELEAAQGARAEAQVEMERADLRAAERDVLRERIAEAEAELSRAATALARTRIDAKGSGIVVDVASRAGSSVRANDTIVAIWNVEQIWMLAWVPEDRVARIAVGDAAEIDVDALGGQVFEGVVHRVLVSEDGQERTLPGQPVSPLLPEETRFAVHVAFDPGAAAVGRLLPGMSGNVRIKAGVPAEDPAGIGALLSWLDADGGWLKHLAG